MVQKRKDLRRSDAGSAVRAKLHKASTGKAFPVGKRAPLQIRSYAWETPATATTPSGPISITDGTIFMCNTIDPGTGDDQRSRHTTMLYKMSLNVVLWPGATTAQIVGPFRVNFWLVYDAAPTGVVPKLTDIFDVAYPKWGNTWQVSRSNVHRFIVKRKWKVDYQSSGVPVGKRQSSGVEYAPVNNVVECNKFFEKLRVKTEWANTSTGAIGDVKKGALYLCANTRQMPAGDSVTTSCTTMMQGSTRLYFKVLGNQ
ncbi:unnamed protein product [Miscanthus streak virus - [91]]|uniref:Capsid protein n=1 Tax=Miscanthus streak virus (isolate 91) TaxID=268776 RepID=CAPSD_MISV9|nr:unnamed protein product [Miscanthus streak virus - [91]]P29073.1 RecName: Full=Capsid protein; AltName: Full=Coat protein; Short=CP [Miscanthus streak virus - [91]]BAA00833.1 unnamed protein product [Miscanthus streak virus - [91]]